MKKRVRSVFFILFLLLMPALSVRASAEGQEEAGGKAKVESIGTVSVSSNNEERETVERLEEGEAVLLVNDTQEMSVMNQTAKGNSSVKLEVGEEVSYEGWFTRFFYIDGRLAYCLEPLKHPPVNGDYAAEVLGNNHLLGKGLYYLYGGPGFGSQMEHRFFQNCNGNMSQIYGLCHAVLSYIYDGCSMDGGALTGMSEVGKQQVVSITAVLKQMEEPPKADLSVSPQSGRAYYDGKFTQRTTSFLLSGDRRNEIRVSIPDGVTLHHETTGTNEKGTGILRGGERYYFTAPTQVTGDWNSGALYGTVRNQYQALIINRDAGSQTIGGWSYTVGNGVSPISFGIRWLDYVDTVVQKEDSELKKPKSQGAGTLEGAVYELVDPNGNVADTITTGRNAQALSRKLPAGEYQIREVEAPKGYLVNTQTWNTIVETKDGSVRMQPVVSRDDVIRGDVELVKFGQDKKGEETEIKRPLEGIEFTLTSTTTGQKYQITTDKKGCATTRSLGNERGGLPYDTYLLEETKGKAGFQLIQPVEITISEEKQTLSYILEDRVIRAAIRVVKTDVQTGRQIPASDTEFRILDEAGKPVVMYSYYPKKQEHRTFRTDKEGQFLLPEKLDYGSYWLEELHAPKGYLKGKPLAFQVEAAQDFEKPLTVTYSDQPAMGRIRIFKIEEKKGTALEGAEFEICAKEDIMTPDNTLRYKSGEIVDTITTDENGEAVSKELYLGSYLVTEVKQPKGYVLDRKCYEITLQYKDQVTPLSEEHLVLENKPVDVQILKEEKGTKQRLPGVRFWVYRKGETPDGSSVKKPYVTDKKGKIQLKYLEAGTYCVEEEAPLPGYLPLEGIREFTVDDSGRVDGKERASIVVENDYTKIRVSKVDAVHKGSIKGAHLRIKDEEGNVVTSWRSEMKPKTIFCLEPGLSYVLEEMQPPAGYKKADDIRFTVRLTGDLQDIVMEDQPAEAPAPKTGDTGGTRMIYLWIGFALLSFGVIFTLPFIAKQW